MCRICTAFSNTKYGNYTVQWCLARAGIPGPAMMGYTGTIHTELLLLLI